ncbi:hypothetical protein BLNAU_10561 [Blattamonas nauphoetae]|uniref:Protein kinase domain-containing protein n=1 Tax=Blattamonas nauphoetae TaxID=2049346 RepID=A0ABQ9XQX2_9EUKA|nr:hypothetical protein BLNAU_10561 [Blattamonas nauphoetae]
MLTANCSFYLCEGSRLFRLSSSTVTDFDTNSVAVVSCTFHTTGGTMHPFCQIKPTSTFDTHHDITLTECFVADVAIDSSSGIVIASPNDGTRSISTTVNHLTCHNMSRTVDFFPPLSHFCPPQERITNSAFHSISDALYGTISTPLWTKHMFLCTNTSFSEFTNTDHHQHNPSNYTFVGQTYNALLLSDRLNVTSLADPVFFVNCIVTSTNPTKHNTFILLTNFSDDFTLHNCSFTVNTTSSLQVVFAKIIPLSGAFPSMNIQKFSCVYGSVDNNPHSHDLIQIERSHTALIVSSNFTTPPDKSSPRSFRLVGQAVIAHISNCQFKGASATGGGGVIRVAYGGELIMSDCLMSDNQATGSGGCVETGKHSAGFHRCRFGHNSAKRGAAAAVSHLLLSVWEDCHFEENIATEGLHFSGNDLFAGYSLSFFNTTYIVGCTSTSLAPKISYYNNAVLNGVHPLAEVLLPDPSTTTDYEHSLSVAAEGSGSTCSEIQPCSTINEALAVTQPLPARNRVMIGTGQFTDETRTISGSVELVGNGWVQDSSFFTTLTSAGMTVGDGGNVNLRSMTLLPLTPNTNVIGMDEEGILRLSFIRIDQINSHSSSLISMSKGMTTLFRCRFDKVNLTSFAFVSVSGSASLNVLGTYFMLITRTHGEGASCIDSESTGRFVIDTSDFGNCSSSGRAGSLLLNGKGQGTISFRELNFNNNEAKTESTTTDGTTLFAHDIVLESFSAKNVSGTTLRSTSPQLSYLRLGVATRIVFFNRFGYSLDGVDFPLVAKYPQAIPASQFTSIKKMTEETFLFCGSVNADLTGLTVPIEPHIVENVTIGWSWNTANPTTTSVALVTVRQNGSVEFGRGSTVFSEPPTVTPYVVEDSTGVFRIVNHECKLSFSSDQMSIPFFSLSAGLFQISGLKISKPLTFLGCSLFQGTGGTIVLSGTSFFQMTSTGNGSVIHATSTIVTVQQCYFEECSSQNGGAIWVELSSSNSLLVTHDKTSLFSTTFLNCRAKERGGAVCVEGTTTLTNPIQFFSTPVNHARFSGNKATLSGNDVYVGKDIFGTKSVQEIGQFGGGSLSDWPHVEIEGREDDEEEMNEIGFIIPLPTVSVNGSVKELTTGMSGTDGEECKWTSSFCATLGYAIVTLRSKHDEEDIEMKAQFVWNMTYSEHPMTVSDQNVKLTGTTAADQNKANFSRSVVKFNDSSVANVPLFSLTNKATLSVSNIDFLLKTTNELFTMDSSASNLNLANCKMIASSDSSSSVSVVSVYGGSVCMEDIQINTTGTSASRFSSPLVSVNAPTSSVSLIDIAFINIEFSSSAIHLITDIAMIVKDLTFSDCQSSSQDPHLVLVEGTDLTNQIVPANWAGHPPTFGGDDEGQYWCTDSSLTSTPFASSTLLVYLLERTEKSIYVNSAGLDVIGCGSEALPCKTLSESITHLRSDTSASLSFQSSGELTSEIINRWTSFVISGGDVNMEKVSVLSTGSLSVPENSLSLSDLSFTASGSSFQHPLISISGTGGLLVDTCSFSSFHSTLPGSVISATLSISGRLQISNTSFSSCTSEGDGGVLWFSCCQNLPDYALLFDCSFDSTCSCGRDSKGGWIFVEGFGFEDLISTTSFQTTSSGLASPANDSLLFGIDHNEQSDSMFHSISLLYYLVEYRESRIYVGPEGRDSNGCGHMDRICRSLTKGHSHLRGASSFELFVVGTTQLAEVFVFDPDNLHLTSKIGRQTIQVEKTGCFVDGDLLGSHILEVSRLNFDLNHAECSALFTTGVGELVMTSCSFAKTGSFDLELINLVGGDLTLENTTFNSASFTRTPIVLNSFTHVEIQKLTFRNCSCDVYVEASGNGENSQIVLDSCHFSSSQESSQPELDEEQICSWSTGMIRLTDSWTTLRLSDFSNARQGGISQNGGWLSLTNTTFSDNIHPSPLFPSIRRNIFCSGNGTILHHLDGAADQNLWIGGTDCDVRNGTETHLSPFFIPSVSSSSTCSFNKKQQSFSIVIHGSTLIPCDLSLKVSEEKDAIQDNAHSSLSLPLDESTTQSFNETSISFEVNLSTLEKELDSEFKWTGRLRFGRDVDTKESFLIKMSHAEEKKAQTKRAMSVVIPIASSLIALLLIISLIIIVFCCRRKKTKKSLAAQKELDQVQEDGDGIKVEEENMLIHAQFTNDLIKPDLTTRSGIDTFHESTVENSSIPSESDPRSERSLKNAPHVEVMSCSGDFATSVISRTDTLFNRLHGDEKREINKRALMITLTRTLQHLKAHIPEAEALTHLSSHWILFDRDNQLYLQLRQENAPLLQHAPQQSSTTSSHRVNPQTPFVHPPQLADSNVSSSNNHSSSVLSTNDKPRESFFRSEHEAESLNFELSMTQLEENSQHFDPNQNIALKHGYTQPLPQPSLDITSGPQQPTPNKLFEGLRWQAPEVVANAVEVDREKAAVFSLGLILWELLTENVPFGEMDAVNAARQNETGGLPRMSLVSNQNAKDTIQQCLQTDPLSRPSFSSLLSRFDDISFSSSTNIPNHDIVS